MSNPNQSNSLFANLKTNPNQSANPFQVCMILFSQTQPTQTQIQEPQEEILIYSVATIAEVAAVEPM